MCSFRDCQKACLICLLKTTIVALNICTVLLVLNLFIVAAASLIMTNGCTHAKWHAVGNPLPPTERIQENATKLLSQEVTVSEDTGFLHLRLALGEKISPE